MTRDNIEPYNYSDVQKEYFPKCSYWELVEELYTPYEPIDFKSEPRPTYYYCKKCLVAKTLPQFPRLQYGAGKCKSCINKKNLKLNKIRTYG